MARGTILNRIHEIEIHRDQTLNEWSENDKFFKDCKKEIAVIESQPIGFSAAAEIEIEKNILVAGGVLWTTIHPILMADCGNGICRFGWKGRNSELIRHELNGHKLLSGMPIFTHNWLVLLLLCGSASIDCWMAGIRLIVVWPSNFIKTMRKHVPSFVGACWWSIWGIQFIHLIFQLLSQKGTISKGVTEESVSLSTSLWLAIKLPDNHPMTHKVHKSRSMQSDEKRKARVQWHSITGQFVVGVSCPCLRGGG